MCFTEFVCYAYESCNSDSMKWKLGIIVYMDKEAQMKTVRYRGR